MAPPTALTFTQGSYHNSYPTCSVLDVSFPCLTELSCAQDGNVDEALTKLLGLLETKQISVEHFIDLYVDMLDAETSMKEMGDAAGIFLGLNTDDGSVPVKLIEAILTTQRQVSYIHHRGPALLHGKWCTGMQVMNSANQVLFEIWCSPALTCLVCVLQHPTKEKQEMLLYIITELHISDTLIEV